MYRCLLFILFLALSGGVKSQNTQPEDKPTTIDKKKLLGAWWDSEDKESRQPIYRIDSATIRFPDEEGHEGHDHQHAYKYHLQGDTFIIYFGRFNDTAQIVKLTDAILEVKHGEQKATFIRNKK